MFIAKNRLNDKVGFMVAKDQADTPEFAEAIAGIYAGVEIAKKEFYTMGCTYTAKIVKNRKKKIPPNAKPCNITEGGIFQQDFTSIAHGTQLFFVVEDNKMKIYADL